MNLLVTGSNGFIGKNLCTMLAERGFNKITKITKTSSLKEIEAGIENIDMIYHLAGVNRPKKDKDFFDCNVEFTRKLINILIQAKKSIPIVFTSSTQAESDNLYGSSKASAEDLIIDYSEKTSSKYFIYRLPNVFGKWSKPNYNSFVSTFCFNIANDLPINIHDAEADVDLVYIDDLCREFISLIDHNFDKGYRNIENVYKTTVGHVANLLYKFKESRVNLLTESVGVGLERALYSTYLSYFKPNDFHYNLESFADERGIFCEFLKTKDSGQISFFTANVGVTRGQHYHHTKNEKFFILKGRARFKFKNILNNDQHEIESDDTKMQVIETIPGWAHDITNIGSETLIVMLWANEVFDPLLPDTIAEDL